MATEHFCLRWNNHQSTLVSVFDNLLESGTLVDCTLAADGRYLKAHKVVLSACSPYLGMLLSQHYDKHPIIILKDVKFDELKAMLDYMYRGEVNISQEQLSTFLKAAESLQIKGLTDTGGEEGNGLVPNRPPSSSSTASVPNDDPPSPAQGDGGSPGPRKRKRAKQDEPPDCEMKPVVGDSDRLMQSAGNSGSPGSAGAVRNVGNVGSVKREPTEEGEGQVGVGDDMGESGMMARPGPSNGGGTNNKGSPWILSADSTGDEMQLTAGQGKSKKTSRGEDDREDSTALKQEEQVTAIQLSPVEETTTTMDDQENSTALKQEEQVTAIQLSPAEETTRTMDDQDNSTALQHKEQITASHSSPVEKRVVLVTESHESNNKTTQQLGKMESRKPLMIYGQHEIEEELIIPDVLEEDSPLVAKMCDKEVEKRIQQFLCNQFWKDHDNRSEDPLATLHTKSIVGSGPREGEKVQHEEVRHEMANSLEESSLPVNSVQKSASTNKSDDVGTREPTIRRTNVDVDTRCTGQPQLLKSKDQPSLIKTFKNIQARQLGGIQMVGNKQIMEHFEPLTGALINQGVKNIHVTDNVDFATLRQVMRKQDLKNIPITRGKVSVINRSQSIVIEDSSISKFDSGVKELLNKELTKYRRILPLTKEATADPTETNKDKIDADLVSKQVSLNRPVQNKINMKNQTSVQSVKFPQQIQFGQYVSIGSQMQPIHSMQNVDIQMQRQFSVSSCQVQTNLDQTLKSVTVQQPNIQTSPAQGNQLHLIQPQFAYTTSQIRATSIANHGGNIQQLTGIVQPQDPINQTSQPFAVSQPVFVAPGMIAESSSQFVPPPSGNQPKLYYVKTNQGYVGVTDRMSFNT